MRLAEARLERHAPGGSMPSEAPKHCKIQSRRDAPKMAILEAPCAQNAPGRSIMRPPEALLPRNPTWGSPHFSGLTMLVCNECCLVETQSAVSSSTWELVEEQGPPAGLKPVDETQQKQTEEERLLELQNEIQGSSCPPLCLSIHIFLSRWRKRGVEFKGGSLHDGFGGFGGSGFHLALLLLVLQNTVPSGSRDCFDGFGGFGGCGGFGRDGYPPLSSTLLFRHPEWPRIFFTVEFKNDYVFARPLP